MCKLLVEFMIESWRIMASTPTLTAQAMAATEYTLTLPLVTVARGPLSPLPQTAEEVLIVKFRFKGS